MSQLAEGPDKIAVIGMAGRFPGAPDVDEFWRLLEQGREGISFLTEDELRAEGADTRLTRREGYVRAKGVLDGADRFDAAFFGYSPREAQIMDPQHRVFLECAWEALESAGCVPQEFGGRIGVFAGAGVNTYLLNNIMANRGVFASAGRYQTLLASDKDFLATRVAYKLGLRGPAITVQTACSTSLAAVHLACQSLLAGECDIALAGGVAISPPLRDGYIYEPGGILSPDGHCRPFDAQAGGTVPGNGVAVVVLRRLADAQAGGDPVDAIILGTAVNNDGSVKAGYTAPSVAGQAEVIAEALAMAEVGADTIGYVEAHGTGTALGDPIEIAALTQAFREHTDATGYCAIGSVKSNVGHLDTAAGVTGLIKAVLALKHRAIPPSLHFTRENPELNLSATPFFVNDRLRPWPRPDGAPRRAGVSSFGIGGTNVHVVLEEAPDRATGQPAPNRPVVLPLSGKVPEAVVEYAGRLADHLAAHPRLGLADVAYTLAKRRPAFEHRTAVVCRDQAEAVRGLRGVRPADVVPAPEKEVRVAFLFSGQGAQYVGMGRDLYQHEPVFRAAVDECAELFAERLGSDLRKLLFAPPDDAAADRLRQTEFTQPALFLIEYALARLWAAAGVRPSVMVGHSIGEYVAACLAGVFSLPDAVRLVTARGRLVQAMPGGAMLSVFQPEAEVARWLTGELSLAAVNSTALSVVSGPAAAVAELERRLVAEQVPCRRLHTSHAFHSPSMDPAVTPFVEEVRQVTRNAPEIPFLSNVTGTWITGEQATDPAYWGRHLREPVRFADAAGLLLADPMLVFVEVGPGHTLGTFLRQHEGWTDQRTVVGSLRHPNEKHDDQVHLLRGLGSLWSAGVPVDWRAAGTGAGRSVVRLPAYAFQRQRYWVEPDTAAPAQEARTSGDLRAASPDDWFYTPGWKRLPLAGEPAETDTGAVWVVLGADLDLGRALAGRLAEAGATVVRVEAGGDFDPARRDHYTDLLKPLAAGDQRALRLVHLFGLAGPADYASLLALAQAIGEVSPGVPVTIDVLCRGLYAVTGEEELEPANVTLAGLSTVVSQELSGVACRVLDLPGAEVSDHLVRAVHDVLHQPTEETVLALRGRHWWYRDFDRVRLSARPGGGTRLRDGGVYLISGGLGGIGLALAEQIASQVDRPVLALLSRSPFPAERQWQQWLDTHGPQDATSARIRRLSRLSERGARVVVYQGDVTDLARMTRHVRDLRDRFGAINGVIHAAGLPSAGMIAHRPPAEAEQVLAAKTRGTLVLDQVCAADELDFMLLCSSVSAVLGGPGQADYAAANAFLDAYAEWKRQTTGAPVTSVAWSTWTGVGMAARLGAVSGARTLGTPTNHPLLRRVTAAGESRTYAAQFSTADSWIVDDHRLMEHGLVPGTAYLELVRAALAEEAGDKVVEFHDVLFLAPVIVPDGQVRTLYLTLDERSGRFRFTVRSRSGDSGPWLEHATGWASLADRGPDTVRDLAEVRAACQATEVIDGEEEILRAARLDRYAAGESGLSFRFGPRWKMLRRIEAGSGRMLATLRLADDFLADLDSYPLHPAMLDVAVGVFRLHVPDPYYLPLAYRRLRVLHPLTGTVYCGVEVRDAGDTEGETLSCDVQLLDPDGRLLVEITGFSVKRINDVAALARQVEQAAAQTDTGTAGPADAEGSPAGPASALRALTEGLSEADGQAAFARIMAAATVPSQLVVAPHDFATVRRLARSLTPDRLAAELDQAGPPATTHPRPDLDTPYRAPGTEEEKAVAAIWQEVLGVEPVGVDDDFFALGGHSLAAVQINTRVQARFGRELELGSFLEAPTVANTARLLAAAADRGPDPADEIEVLDRTGSGDPIEDIEELSDDEVEARLRSLLAEEE